MILFRKIFCTIYQKVYYLCNPKPGIGMWRSWLAHHVRDVGVVCSSQIIPTKQKRMAFAILF